MCFIWRSRRFSHSYANPRPPRNARLTPLQQLIVSTCHDTKTSSPTKDFICKLAAVISTVIISFFPKIELKVYFKCSSSLNLVDRWFEHERYIACSLSWNEKAVQTNWCFGELRRVKVTACFPHRQPAGSARRRTGRYPDRTAFPSHTSQLWRTKKKSPKTLVLNLEERFLFWSSKQGTFT